MKNFLFFAEMIYLLFENYRICVKISAGGADRRRRREKLRILAKKSVFRSKKTTFFSEFRGGGGPPGPPLATPLALVNHCISSVKFTPFYICITFLVDILSVLGTLALAFILVVTTISLAFFQWIYAVVWLAWQFRCCGFTNQLPTRAIKKVQTDIAGGTSTASVGSQITTTQTVSFFRELTFENKLNDETLTYYLL